jgi:hypothetical protein
MPLSSLLRGTPVDYQPLSTNRFYLEFPTDINIEGMWVQSVGAPEIDIRHVDIHYFNTKSTMATNYSWGPIDIEMIDVIAPSSSMKLMEWIRLHAESYTGRMGYDFGMKKDLYLTRTDGVGVPVQQWLIAQASITKANFGDNKYADGELVLPKFTVQPFFCERLY